MYTIAEIEDGIITTLQADADLNAWCRKIETLAVDLEREIEKLTLIYPACYVAYLEGRYGADSMTTAQDKTGTFAVIALTQNLRGNVSARHGDIGGTGAYEVLDKIRKTLTYSTLGGLNILRCIPTREVQILNTSRLAAYAIEFEIDWRFES